MSISIIGIPDVPNGNIAAAETLLQCNSSLTVVDESNNGVYSKLPPSALVSIGDLSKYSLQEPIKISLKITLLDSIKVQWESLLINEILYVYMPTGNSKEAFIALLEFAEEELHCKKVIVYFDKQNPDRNVMIRLFNFIGFTLLPPNHPLIDAGWSDDMVYLCYDIYG